ncbi:MAG: acetate/propionate family kinase [Acidobacteria bacterium]|nr:acetate/propionate family kinase [Acidobacteriota bacterium]
MASPTPNILVLNSGSSSLKFGVFAPDPGGERLLLKGGAQQIGRAGGKLEILSASGERLLSEEHVLESQPDALAKIAALLRARLDAPPAAVGHRIVHGGPHLRQHQPLSPAVLAGLRSAVHFAPLHIPAALSLVEQAERLFPAALQVACFDTAFHRTMPEAAARLPLPSQYFELGVIRYGFHGLSCESLVRQLGAGLPRRAVFAHLGSGCSVTAVLDGRSIDTSMGLTPAGGVPMSTRTGDLDPGVVLYLMRNQQMGADALEQMLNRESGLCGISEGEGDMQALLARAAGGDARAALAVEAFCIAVRKFVAGYAALMGGLDLLVFTGGIGENSADIRRRICGALRFMGLHLEGPGGRVRVVGSDEEGQIARHCRAFLGGATQNRLA